METTSTQPIMSPSGSGKTSENSSLKPSPGQKPSPIGQKPQKPKKPTYSGSSKNSSTVRSRTNSAQKTTEAHNISFLSESSSSECNKRHYNFKMNHSYLGSLKNDPSIDSLMEFCQMTIDTMV